MMKNLGILSILCLLLITSCDEGYIDDINAVDPGPDSADPEVVISFPSGDITIPFRDESTDVEFRFRASDDIELQSLNISLDGNQLQTYNDFVDYRSTQASFLVEGLEIGEYTFLAEATDLAGKTSQQTITFEISNTYTPQEGEVFYMPFEGNELRDLISEELGSSSGSIQFNNGVTGEAVTLDGSESSYLTFPSNPQISGVESFTLSYWTRVEFVDEDENGGIDGVIGFVSLSNTSRFWGNINTYMENGSSPANGANLRVQITNGSDEVFLTNIPDEPNIFGQWSHHVIMYNNSDKTIKYYINGVEKSSIDASWDTDLEFQDSGQLVMGCLHFMTDPSSTSATGPQTWASYLTGELDEIRIFEKALSASEVETLYNSERP